MLDFIFYRDINGKNRLFYDVKGETFTSSSTLDRLLSEILYKPKANLQSIKDFIWTFSIHPQDTFYEGIHRVPPGYKLFLEDGSISVQRWWKPENIKIDYTLSLEEAKIRFNQILEKSVEKCIEDKDNIGCELSGGFDSSSIFCIASQKSKSITALTMEFDNKEANEQDYANSVFQHCSKKEDIHYKVKSDCIDYKNKYTMKYNYDLNPHWPIWTTFTMKSHILEYLLANDIKTVLNGQFGDPILYSTPNVLEIYLYQRKIFRFFKELFYLEKPFRWIYKFLKKKLLLLLNPKLKENIKKFLKRRNKDIHQNKYYDFYFDLSSFKDYEINKRIINLLTNANFYMFVDSNFSRSVSDKYNIEFCSPYGDKDLIEFMLTLPPTYLYSMGNRRNFHGFCMQKILPKKLINRRDKAFFSQTIIDQIHAIDRKLLWKNATIVSMGIVTYEYIMALEKKFSMQTISSQDRSLYWRMINIEYWYTLNPHLNKSEFAPNPYVLESCKD